MIEEEQQQYLLRIEELTAEGNGLKNQLYEERMRHEEEMREVLGENHELKERLEGEGEKWGEWEEKGRRYEEAIQEK